MPFFAVEASINNWYFALGDTATPELRGRGRGGAAHLILAWFGVYASGAASASSRLASQHQQGLKVIALYGSAAASVSEPISRAAIELPSWRGS
jgi:hypothetical protein